MYPLLWFIIALSTILSAVTFWLDTSFVWITTYSSGREEVRKTKVWPFFVIISWGAGLLFFLMQFS